MPRVSVIVPVYKVEEYLDRCVSSIVNQTWSDLEILLIDDGSPDRCPQMCDAWAEKDGRIRVIHKENAGLGMARNTGIEHAGGKYICFFDGDDYIAENTIELAVKAAEQERADLVLFGMVFVNGRGRAVKSVPETRKPCYRGAEVLHDLLPSVLWPDVPGAGTRNVLMSACCCLYSMELIRRSGWRFVSERDILSEDVYSLLDLYQNVQSAAVLTETLYHYCENSASLSQTYRPDRFVRNREFYQACIGLCNSRGYPEIVKKGCISPFLSNTIAAMKQEAVHHRCVGEAMKGLRKIVEDPVLQEAVKQKHGDLMNRQQRILLWSIGHKYCGLCYVLLRVKILLKKWE